MSEYEYECLCREPYPVRVLRGDAVLSEHCVPCMCWNRRRQWEQEQAWLETGIARHWREQEEMTGIERVNQ